MVRVAAVAFKAALSGKDKNLVLAEGSCSSKTRSSRTLNTPWAQDRPSPAIRPKIKTDLMLVKKIMKTLKMIKTLSVSWSLKMWAKIKEERSPRSIKEKTKTTRMVSITTRAENKVLENQLLVKIIFVVVRHIFICAWRFRARIWSSGGQHYHKGRHSLSRDLCHVVERRK